MEDDIAVLRQERQAEEILHLGAIDFLGPVPIELVEGLERREASGGQAARDGQLLSAQRFALHQPRQIIDMGPLLVGRLGRQGPIMFLHIQELQGGELFAQPRLARIHGSPPCSV